MATPEPILSHFFHGFEFRDKLTVVKQVSTFLLEARDLVDGSRKDFLKSFQELNSW